MDRGARRTICADSFFKNKRPRRAFLLCAMGAQKKERETSRSIVRSAAQNAGGAGFLFVILRVIDLVPEGDDQFQRIHRCPPVVFLFGVRQLIVRDEAGMLLVGVVPFLTVRPALGDSSLGPDVMHMLGDLLRQVFEFCGEFDLAGVDRVWGVRSVFFHVVLPCRRAYGFVLRHAPTLSFLILFFVFLLCLDAFMDRNLDAQASEYPCSESGERTKRCMVPSENKSDNRKRNPTGDEDCADDSGKRNEKFAEFIHSSLLPHCTRLKIIFPC